MIEKIDEIRTVKQWANKAGYSRRWLNKNIQNHYTTTPSIMMRQVRFESIKASIEDSPEDGGYIIARKNGLSDDIALSKFLRRNYDLTLNGLKESVIDDASDLI